MANPISEVHVLYLIIDELSTGNYFYIVPFIVIIIAVGLNELRKIIQKKIKDKDKTR